MSNSIKSSVVTVTYNSASYVEECLDALGRQETEGAFEIIVVDNGSMDETRELVRTRYPEVTLIETSNRGFGTGNNVGAARAQGKFLAFINPDTVPAPDWLAELTKPLKQKKLRICTSKILLMDNGKRINTCGNQLHFTGFGFPNGFGRPAEAYHGINSVDGISGAAFAIRKSTFELIGGFDEDFFLYCEDTELSWRARRHGCEIMLVASSQLAHRYELMFPQKKLYYLEFGRWLLLKKHYRVKEFLLLFPSLLMSVAIALAYAVRHGPSGLLAILRGLLNGLAAKCQRYDSLPPLRLEETARTAMPFSLLTTNPLILLCGHLANGLFRLNFALYKLLSRRN